MEEKIFRISTEVRSMSFQYSTPINDNTWGRSFRPLLTLTGPGSGGFAYSSDFLPVDTLTLGGQGYPVNGFRNDTMVSGGFTSGLPAFQNDRVTLGNISYSSGGAADVATMSNGQSIEDVFNNPYTPDTMYLKEALDKIAAARAIYGAGSVGSAPKKEAQKGDLRVIAGDRADGVKPKEVRIDDANDYDWQKYENSYQDNRQEARFKDGTIGREYDVTVTWADGTTTKKRVTLKEPGQIVYMNDAYSY